MTQARGDFGERSQQGNSFWLQPQCSHGNSPHRASGAFGISFHDLNQCITIRTRIWQAAKVGVHPEE